MKRFVLGSIMFFMVLGSISAQNFSFIPHQANKPAAGENDASNVKILAVMVDFQADKDEATYGNGKFGTIYSKDYGKDIIDPLPHDAPYFQAHLEFAKNYYAKVSKGKVSVSYNLLPDIITVSKTMRNYAPEPKSSDLNRPVLFAQEVWSLAAEKSDIDFSQYNLFVIFHAGVGRDITGQAGLTVERDIPSVYLSEKTLKTYLGEDFHGFPVNNGNFSIKNSMIIPETESREFQSLNQTVLLELSINGLIAASIASHLGLPDLYNTKTGYSAIGRYGLMDGQSMFAFSGLFPPEPSAWEKIFLGWETPVEISPGEFSINLSNYLTAETGDTVFLKVPINVNEYYLIENRKRDALNNGCILSVYGGKDSLFSFAKDTSGFISYDTEALSGVVTDVDEFDWALPGPKINYNDSDKFEDIGLLIWHIDESVINANIATNSINNNPERKGVKLIEADGIFDIGVEFQTFLGEKVIGEGSREDSWYASNPVTLYENKFTPETKPNTNDNSGAVTGIGITGFGNPALKMPINIGWNFNKSIQLISFKQGVFSGEKDEYLIYSDENRYAFLKGSNLILVNVGSAPVTFPGFSSVKTSYFPLSSYRIIAGGIGNQVNILEINSSLLKQITISDTITSDIIFTDISKTIRGAVAVKGGKIIVFEITDLDNPVFEVVQTLQIQTEKQIKQILFVDGQYVAVTENEIIAAGNKFTAPDKINYTAVTELTGGNSEMVVLTEAGEFFILENYREKTAFECEGSNTLPKSFIMADLKNDGNNYIIYAAGEKLIAVNKAGVKASEFSPWDNSGFTDYLLSADINIDKLQDIIAVTKDGKISAFSGSDGKMVKSFPLALGGEQKTYPILTESAGRLYLTAISGNGKCGVWAFEEGTGKAGWMGMYKSNSNNNVISEASSELKHIDDFVPETAYNYPNPAYGNTTYFRFYAGEDAEYSIDIFDLAGSLAGSLKGKATGGIENEVRWDISSVQSGAYFAKLELKSPINKSKIIKVAVIK